MCCKNKTSEVNKLLKNKSNVFKFYKRLKYDKLTGQLESPYECMIYKYGINVSNARDTKIYNDNEDIRRGIHLWRDKKLAEYKVKDFNSWDGGSHCLVEFTCFKNDLLGSGTNDVVFRAVVLEEKEYKRVIKNAKRRMANYNNK